MLKEVAAHTARRLATTPAQGSVIVIDPSADRVSDSELVRRGIAGDEWALEAIYRRYVLLVAGTARRLLRASNDVDDVVQDTFLAAFAKLDTLLEPDALRGWLAKIAVSRVHRRYRWRRCTDFLTGQDPHALLEQQADAGASPEHLAELALIDRAARRMPVKLRTAWVLRRVLGLALDEVATACGCSLATAKRRIADADAIVTEFVGEEAS
jgi:RNA polymerase sigma-70 factor (ECF subfamily)